MGLLSKWLESLDFEYGILSSCSRHRSPLSTCLDCVSACEENAISIVDNKPIISRTKCKECGYCISACPVQSVAGIYPQRKIIKNQLVISDQQSVTAKELLILYKKGINEIISDNVKFIEMWKDKIDDANSILEQLNEKPFIVSIKKIADEPVTRRELFSIWKTEGKSVVKQVSPAKWRFNQSDFNLPKYYKDFQFTAITVNTHVCTLCSACHKLCEKNCFDIQSDYFSINSQGCTSCNLCVDICPEHAIKVTNMISMTKRIDYNLHEKVCLICNRPFKTLREDDLECFVCAKQENHKV